MKGVTLPIETIVILALAIIVLGVLLFFFTTTSSPAIDLVKLKQEQSIFCSSYQQQNPDCDEERHEEIVTDFPGADQPELFVKLAGVCSKLNIAEGGYPACTGQKLDYPCVIECCKMYCGGAATTT